MEIQRPKLPPILEKKKFKVHIGLFQENYNLNGTVKLQSICTSMLTAYIANLSLKSLTSQAMSVSFQATVH
jgi:hypothetical protein